ncbi:hypothetical protein MCEMIE11_00279 [Burkholderiales bacterium]
MIIIKFPAVVRVLGVRFGGAGLGNLLFVVGRAIKEREISNTKRIFTMPLLQFNIGPLIRRESDLRLYLHYVLSTNSGSLCLIEAFMAIVLSPKSLHAVLKFFYRCRDVRIIEGLGNYFNDFIGYDYIVRAEVLAQLCTWSRSRNRCINPPEVERDSGPSKYAVIHVRGGDFPEKWRVDTDWYVRACETVISNQKHRGKLYILSNDKPLGIAVMRSLGRSGIHTEMVELSNVDSLRFMSGADYVIGNNSTFSAWGAYLGSGRLISKFIVAFDPPLKDSYLKVEYVP